MFTHKDIETRTIFVINCMEAKRSLRVQAGELLLEEVDGATRTTLTKFPFQKLLALFVVGHTTLTTPLIDKCKKFGVALVVMKPNLRPVFFWADSAEGNFLLRARQFEYGKASVMVARCLVRNKLLNQRAALLKTRKRDHLTDFALGQCEAALAELETAADYQQLMGLEGRVAKAYFAAYFQDLDWHGRHPRMKCDALNLTLDIGYTVLFNFVECFLRLFGFDVYVGVYHRLWFKRKSLVCDLVEPFRCLIDHATLLAFHRGQFSARDFSVHKLEYQLNPKRAQTYYKVFYESLIPRKAEIFAYVQAYYRAFMGGKAAEAYPTFEF